MALVEVGPIAFEAAHDVNTSRVLHAEKARRLQYSFTLIDNHIN